MHLVVPGTCNETVDYIMLIMYMVCQKITVYYEAPVFEAATNILKAWHKKSLFENSVCLINKQRKQTDLGLSKIA